MSPTKRLSVPIGVATIVGLVVAFGPSLMASARPSLPQISAQQLLVNMARSDVDGLSGVVESRSQLGLPQLPSGQGGGHHDYGVAPRDLLTGTHTLRVATAGPEKQRVALLGKLSQYTLVHNGRDVWAYDSAENTAVHWQLPKGAYDKHDGKQRAHPGMGAMTPQQMAQHFLDKIGPSTKVNVSGTDTVAGRDVYTLSLSPRSADSKIGRVQLYVDAENWTPLRVTATPRGGGAAAIDVGFRDVSFGAPPASRFTFTPPEGAKVKEPSADWYAHRPLTKGSADAKTQQKEGASQHARPHGQQDGPRDGEQAPEVIGQGWSSVLKIEDVQTGRLGGWLARAGSQVSGDFGQGQIITTRLVTALVTDDGTAYVGAVTPEALKEAAAK